MADPLGGLALTRLRARPLGARFVSRPHRFAARVRLRGGEEVEAHLPDPGRLAGTLVPGCAVLLDGPRAAGVCRYTLVAVREGGTLVSTVPVLANRIFSTLWQTGFFPELTGSALSAEIRHGRSRFDFQVGDALVEVKSVTLARGREGRFPDAVTARGARHCTELATIARAGSHAALVFVTQRGDVDSVAPEDEIDPAFAAALRAAVSAGVVPLACAVEITPEGPRSARRIPMRGI